MTNDIRDLMANAFQTELVRQLEGAGADLEGAAQEVATMTTQAAAEGREDLLVELQGQAEVIFERRRVSLAGGGGRLLRAMVGVGFQVAAGWLAERAARTARAMEDKP